MDGGFRLDHPKIFDVEVLVSIVCHQNLRNQFHAFKTKLDFQSLTKTDF